MEGQETKIMCGDCGQEMKQEGVLIKCTNSDCKAQFAIDVNAVMDAQASANTENEEESRRD